MIDEKTLILIVLAIIGVTLLASKTSRSQYELGERVEELERKLKGLAA